jgi:hypothetical protein
MSRILLLLVLIMLVPGCYHTRVLVNNPDPATEYQSEVTTSYFWGLVQNNPVAKDCLSNRIDEVRVSTNFGYLLVSVATLGIVVPMQVEWRCAKDCPR